MANNIPKWQQQMRAEKEAELLRKQQEKKRNTLIGICVAAVVLIAAIVLAIIFAPKTAEPVETAAREKTVDMSAVKEEIDSRQVSEFTESDTPTDYIRLAVQDYGEMVVRLIPETAPITVSNFKDLVSRHFYDGLTFHRIYPGFMIQGGDPDGNGTGGSGTDIKGEFELNGIQNDLSHIRGVISMARATPPDTASSQFFICHADAQSSLDGRYAAFGYVVAGLSTVDAICEVELEDNGAGEVSHPVTPVILTSATFVTPN